jgi:hypothetical protein
LAATRNPPKTRKPACVTGEILVSWFWAEASFLASNLTGLFVTKFRTKQSGAAKKPFVLFAEGGVKRITVITPRRRTAVLPPLGSPILGIAKWRLLLKCFRARQEQTLMRQRSRPLQ